MFLISNQQQVFGKGQGITNTLPRQGGHQGSEAGRQAGRVLFTLFSDPKMRWDTLTDFGPQGPEQVPPAPKVQDADSAVKQAVLMGDWFTTVNFKDAYFQIQIWESHRRFLGLAFDGKIFKFCVLPFGISLAPHTFTRCMDAVLGPLQQEGLRVMNYLDDWLICAQTEEQCRQHVQMLLPHIQGLGLHINDKKRNLQLRPPSS